MKRNIKEKWSISTGNHTIQGFTTSNICILLLSEKHLQILSDSSQNPLGAYRMGTIINLNLHVRKLRLKKATCLVKGHLGLKLSAHFTVFLCQSNCSKTLLRHVSHCKEVICFSIWVKKPSFIYSYIKIKV